MIKTIIIAAMVAASFGTVAITVSAPVTAAEIIVRRAPPPPRNEAAPAPRRGYVWVGGHWDWRNGRHQWVRGNWVRERRGYIYNQPVWVERDGRWVMTRGAWRRGDRDGDGVPNRMDRDRDGDGVRNRQDRRPDDPRRY